MPEVHFETAKNSELIFTLGTRHLCSSVHPTREGQQWIAHHQSVWDGCRFIIVLGLGCGYHIRALKIATKSEASVLTLEPSKDVIQSALRVHPLDLSESEIIQWNSIAELATIKALKEATQGSYCVLVHEPSAFANPQHYSQTKEFLLGREKQGLRWLFQNRGLTMPEFISEDEVNLKTLDPLWQKQLLGEEPLQPVMQALRELIA